MQEPKIREFMARRFGPRTVGVLVKTAIRRPTLVIGIYQFYYGATSATTLIFFQEDETPPSLLILCKCGSVIIPAPEAEQKWLEEIAA